MQRRTTFKLVLVTLRENLKGLLLAGGVVALVALFLWGVHRSNAPLIARDEATGRVIAITFASSSGQPDGTTPRYRYVVELSDGRGQVQVRGPVSRPHSIGAEVRLLRSTRSDGRVTYELR